MKSVKKSLYEWLQVSENASPEAISAAHGRLVDELIATRAHFDPAEFDLRMQTLQMALSTLSSPSSRFAYDTTLSNTRLEQRLHQPAPRGGSRKPAGFSDEHALGQAIGSHPTRVDSVSGAASQSPLIWLLSTLKSSLTKTLVFIGLLSLMGMVLQVLFFRATVTNAPTEFQHSAEEKAVIQEYFQTHGVRPNSREDAELMAREERRQNAEKRQAERERAKAEFERQRFEQESRRRADQVSEALRRSENEALERALRSP
jgi:curved DNA-binding protein CbpA